MLRALLVLVVLALWGAPVAAQDRAALARQFQGFLASEIWPQARAEGVPRAIFEAALAGARPDLDLPGLALPGTPGPARQHQAEFSAPAAYFRRAAVEGAAATGRRMAARHAVALAAAERRTGVPGHIVLAIWGRESAYGAAAIPHDLFRVLATRAFLDPRAAYYRGELIAALKVLARGPVPRAAMKSSWAGAMGQPQFMPSSYLAHAADGDGDGRADIWTSAADTIASIARYLADHGWVAGRDWGYEVTLPAGVSCTLEGPDQGRPLAAWEAMGIARVSGRPFPAAERRGPMFLMLPAGRRGPAFLVTPNFFVLKDYNTSDLYALFVGHVGDRIAFGAGAFRAPWAPLDRISRGQIAALQRGLVARGHDVGGVDGLPGFKTRRAIGRWQEGEGLAPTCFPDRALAAALAR
ncbi:lytic murein transglycosylase [Phaeovulum vinaykumarii]|uniref:Lytic murein transglycosylase n=1 Tax=Phaeovulum vinaykumarii TaxID=407234 RepID=A0A1N7JWA6_9RHOB|nr:lytic murein transglycosylase [Phaeovulum vinaykumarii]SIS53607.1 lytic murein transglycosylase [Phaeovulum vinaykumarii]SOB91650.1 lytic murein transglycosylase [Phaeovulum vinaykumarii]